MADTMRLRVVLDMAERVLAPLKRIQSGSSDTAKALKAASDKLKELNKAERDVAGYRQTRVALRQQTAQLQAAQAKSTQYSAALEEQRTRHVNITGSLRAAKHAYNQITTAYQDGKIQGAEYTRQIELARITLLSNQQAHERSLASVNKYKAQIKNTSDRVAGLTQSIAGGTERLAGYKARLDAAGIDTGRLGAQSRTLKGSIEASTASIERQKEALRALGEQQKKLTALNEKHGKDMMRVGMVGAGGVAAMAAGSKIAAPLRSVVGAFMPAEDAQTQLRASMMQANGGVPAEYGQILELATRLGDRLPGTTADFIEMMTMLRRQGMSAKTILGGLGESAAYLGVQLRMPVTAAAEFAAKLQDATQTAESDMMGLTDLIQRGFYLGVDSGNMLQGFTKMSPVLDVLGEKGLGAARKLAPLLVMMDQSGMAGESAGNAIRKVFQAGLDAKKLDKANAALKDAGAGFKLNFTNGKGEFGGIDQMFAQLDRLKALNSVQRTGVIKALFGDDAETLQVLNTLMAKGVDGYREVGAKMQAQADLRKRVDEQLGTVSASIEAAQGSFTNMLKDMGATIAPDLVRLANALGKVASAVGAWVRENPELVKWALRVVGVLAVLVTGAGALALAYASVVGPFLLLRFALAKYSLALSAANAATKAAGPAMGMLYRLGFLAGRAFAFLRGGAALLLGGLRALAAFMIANPIVAVFALLAFAAYMVWRNWDSVVAGGKALWGDFTTWLGGLWDKTKSGAIAAWTDLSTWLGELWDGIAQKAASIWGRIKATISNLLDGGVAEWSERLLSFSPLGILWGAITTALDALGISVPERFRSFGGFVIDGLIGGITSRAAALRDAVVGIASSVGQWFKEKLGINSPSRVFMEFGGWVSEGAALGIAGGQGAVRNAALGMATAATLAMPMAADAAALRLDTRPPMGAHMAAQASGGSGGNTYTITINPAPGMDAQAIARAVSAELDRRERSQQSRRLSRMGDID